MLKIEIISGACAVQSRSFTNKNTGELNTFYIQPAYAHLGDAFPVKINVPLISPEHAYSAGFYTLSLQSYRVGNFGDLEIDRYNRDNFLVAVK